jgi:hypothetical protein
MSAANSTNNNIEAVANQMPTGGSGEFNPKPAGASRENHDGVSDPNLFKKKYQTPTNTLPSTSPVSS